MNKFFYKDIAFFRIWEDISFSFCLPTDYMFSANYISEKEFGFKRDYTPPYLKGKILRFEITDEKKYEVFLKELPIYLLKYSQ